jgi:hypothetical protein
MGASEFDEAYEDDEGPRERAEQQLGEAILSAPIRLLEPRPAVTVGGTIAETIRLCSTSASRRPRGERRRPRASSPNGTSCAAW